MPLYLRLFLGKRLAFSLFIAACFLQVAAFVFYMNREVVWSPYMAVDSHWYLYFNYQFFTALRDGQAIPHDLLASPQGIFFYLHAALFQFVLGADRIGAIAINLFYYLAFQGMVMLSVWRATGSRISSLVAYALALLVLSPVLNTPGQPNLADFYPDIVTGLVCGIFFCCVLLSDCFRRPHWAIAAGFIAGLQVALRIVTISTVAATYAVWICVLLAVVARARDPSDKQTHQTRLKWMLASGLVAGLLALIALAPALETFHSYYLGWLRNETAPNLAAGHPEALAVGILDKLLYYPITAFHLSIGKPFTIVALVAIIILVALGHPVASKNTPGYRDEAYTTGDTNWKLFIIFMLVAALVAYALLTFFPARSPFMARLLGIPLVILVIAFIAMLVARVESRATGYSGLLRAIPAAALFSALVFQAAYYVGPGPSHELRQEWIQLRQMYAKMGDYLNASGTSFAKISSDVLVPYSGGYAQNFSAMEFERTGKLFSIIPGFKNDGDTNVSRESIHKLRNSDIILLDDLTAETISKYARFARNPTLKRDKLLMERTSPPLRAFAHRNFTPISSHPMFGGNVVMLAAIRPELITSSMSPPPDRSLLVEGNAGWQGKAATGPAWIQFDYRFATRIAAVEIFTAFDSPHPLGFILQGRADDGSWIPLLNAKFIASDTPVHKLVSPNWFRSYRIEFLSDDGRDLSVALGHIRFVYTGYAWSNEAQSFEPPINPQAWEPASGKYDSTESSYPPKLLLSTRGYNIVDFAGLFWGVPQGMEVRWGDVNLRGKPGVMVDTTVKGLVARIPNQPATLLDIHPRLLETRGSYNLVAFRGVIYAIPQAVGKVRLGEDNINNIPGIMQDSSIESLRRRIDNVR
jgi:hypothetical protein